MKTWMIISFNVVCCHTLSKNLPNHVTRMLYSLMLLLKKKKKLKAHQVTEEILFLERFPWTRFETEWNTDINSFTVMVVIHTYTASLFLSLSRSLFLS